MNSLLIQPVRSSGTSFPRRRAPPHPFKLASSSVFISSFARVLSNCQHPVVDMNLSSQSGTSVIWMFLSGVYPIGLGRFSLRAGLVGPKPKDLEARIRGLLSHSEDFSSAQLRIEKIEPRVKEGGAFIKFTSPTPIELQLLRSDLLTKLKERNIKPFWLIWAKPDLHLVQGKPWLEDMNWYPNQKILVEFQGPALSLEELWSLIRPFGRVKEITMPTPKDHTQIAQVTLDSARSAAIARGCLHGSTHRVVPCGSSTTLRILYSPPMHARTARNWLSSHPRIVLPILTILLGGVSYALFDPIRQFFIRSNIAGTFDMQQNPIFSWLQKETVARLGFDRYSNSQINLSSSSIEKERGDAIRDLSSWISGNPESFIVVLGPKGCGKTEVVQSVLNERRNTLFIDCAKLTEDVTSENLLVAHLAQSLGYFPQFSFLSSVNNAIDLATGSLLGQKAGFSSTPQDQIAQILDNAEKAIRSLANKASASRQLESKKSSQTEHRESEKEGMAHFFQKAVKNIIDTSLAGCSDIPVVVLKDITIKDSTKHRILWECLADWANRLTEKGIAHVIFTTENTGALKPLAQVLSRQPVKSIVLSDATIDNAMQYVFRRLSRDPMRKVSGYEQYLPLIQVVGGRLTDLDALVQKVESGLELEFAVEEILNQAMAEIKRNCFVGDHESGATYKELAWKNHQVWNLIKRLSKQEEIPAYPILSEIFDGDFSKLSALEATDLITLSSQENGEILIKIGKPVYRTAIKRLLGQKYFAASNDLNLAKNQLAKAEQSVQDRINELIEIGKLFPTIHTLGSDRGNWLFGTSFSNEKIPNQIKWKVRRILEELNKHEKIVDLMENDIKQAQLILQAQ